MVKTDALEGIINDTFRFHYDLFADVLYLRLLANESAPTLGEVTDDGDILLREETTNQPVGLTVISCWKRFGHGTLPDSLTEISKKIEPLTKRIAA